MALEIEIREYGKSNFIKPKYFDWTPGQHQVRLLELKVSPKLCYWFNTWVEALGWDDPQATQNKMIKLENPENFKTVRGYRPPTDRYAINVLDRTPVKMCPACSTEVKAVNGTFPNICPHCKDAVLTEVEVKPLNEVRIVQGGKTLFEQFKPIENRILNDKGEPIGIENFDIVFHVVGLNAQRQTIVVETNPLVTDDIKAIGEFALYDTSVCTNKVSEDELAQLVRGVALKDIWAARRGKEEVKSVVASTESKSIDPDMIQRKVDELFN